MNNILLFLQIKSDWITGLFLFILVLIGAIKYLYKERLIELSFLFFSKRYLIRYSKDQKGVFNRFNSILFIVQTIVFSLIIYLAILLYNAEYQELNDILLFLKIVLLIVGYFVVRYLIGMILAIVFQLEKAHEKIVFVKMSYLFSVSLIILPFLIFAYFVNIYNLLAFQLLLVVLSILLIMRYVFVLISNKNTLIGGLFYFILYLCALEIAPLLLIFKIIN